MSAVRPPFCPLPLTHAVPHAAIFGFVNILTHAHDRATILELDLRLCIPVLIVSCHYHSGSEKADLVIVFFESKLIYSAVICPPVVAGTFLKPVGQLLNRYVAFLTVSSRHPGH
jgi:hypothetical protein